MATTYGMTAPMMSSTMPNPMGTVQTAMIPSMMGQSPMGMNNANMNLPLSTARPIEVTETTPNLEQIQNFPVAGRAADGTHFHQDPVSGQMYRMSAELHDRIPEILKNKSILNNNLLFGLSQQFQNPRFIVSKNSLVSQVMDYVNGLENNRMDSIETMQKSIDNEYRGLYPEYDLTLSEINSYNYQKLYDYLQPINKINNFSPYEIQNNNYIKRYIPINHFFVQQNFNQTIYSIINQYIPINRFYNR